MIRHRFTMGVSAAEALVAHRDGLPGFASDLPGLTEVRLESRIRDGSVQVLQHRWQGDHRVLPASIRRAVPADALSWRDLGRWDASAGTGTWEIHIPVLGAGPHIQGMHRFRDTSDGCVVEVTAELSFVANAETRLLGIRLGPLLAPLLSHAVRQVFTRIVTHSGHALEAHVPRLQTGARSTQSRRWAIREP